MNKKLISALFVGALLLGSTSALTSCKDYDDDIDNLQTQIDKMATADELSSNVATLQAAITAAQTAATNAATAAKSAADAAAKAQTAADAAATQKALDAAIAELKSQISTKADQTTLDNAVKALQEALGTKVDKTVYDGAIAKLESSIGTKVDTIAYNAAVKALYEAVALKADKTALTEAVATLNEAIGKKVDQTAFDAAVAQLKADIATKVSQSDYKAKVKELEDALGTKVDIVEYTARIAALEATLDTKANQTALDDAVARLESLIDAKANKADIETALKKVNGAIGINTDDIKLLKDQVRDLATNVDAYVKDLKDKEAEDVKGLTVLLTDQYKALNVITTKLIGEVSSMITSVDLYAADYNNQFYAPKRELRFFKVTEKENDFVAPKGGDIRFKEGFIRTYEDSLIIRVAPTTASLIKKNISLLNSKGETLDDFVNVSNVESYTDLLTRSTGSASGLWKVVFKLKDNVDLEKFLNTVTSKDETSVLFSVAIKSAITGGDDTRRVVSEYGIRTFAKDAPIANNLDFYVDDTNIEDIHNRYSACEDKTSTSQIPEYVWNNTAAVTPVYTGTNVNVTIGDNRQGVPILAVVKGEPISLKLFWDKTYNEITTPIKGFYVTLDSKRALESAPSEINAWKSYSIDNLDELQWGNKGSITVKGMNVERDIIGFRVFAVNLDGTLVDPDGRAFYVTVGGEIATSNFETKITPNNNFTQVFASPLVAITDDLSDINHTTLTIDADSDNPLYHSDNPLYGEENLNQTIFYVKYYDEDKQLITNGDYSKAKYISTYVSSSNMKNFINGKTYKEYLTYKNTAGNTVRVVTVTMTKVMPASLPTAFGAKMNQVVDGVYKCYLTPDNWNANQATVGQIALNNAFDGLYTNTTPSTLYDPNYIFNFEESELSGNDKVTASCGPNYAIIIKKDFIDDTTEHNTTVDYAYNGISTYQKDPTDPNSWAIGDPYTVKNTYSFKTIFCSYFSSPNMTWSWDKPADAKVTYGITGQTLATSKIKSKNLFDATDFSKDLFTFLNDNRLAFVEAHLNTVNADKTEVKDQYFTVDIASVGSPVTGYNVAFTPSPSMTGAESNPKDVVASILRITTKDCYGHKVEIALDMVVNPK